MTAMEFDSQRASAFRGRGGVSLPARDEIAAAHLSDELRLVGGLIERAVPSDDERRRAEALARRLAEAARTSAAKASGIEAFTREYGLSSEEGIILMCIAEALLRIPDAETADALIAEKLGEGAWEKHLGHSDSLTVNASTWGLMLTGRMVRLGKDDQRSPVSAFKRLVAKSGEPVIRRAVRHAVGLMGSQFVMGRTIGEALGRAKAYEAKGYLLSYDMLGEAARSEADAKAYFDRYLGAIEAIGAKAGPLAQTHPKFLMARPGISIKLSALHPRVEPGKEARLSRELAPRLLVLARAAREAGLTVTVDVEEQERLHPTLETFGEVFLDPTLAGWHGFGIAVQAYSKRAIAVLRWLRALAHQGERTIPVRLVKGAYWDSEIKWAQQRGWESYPVFTRKIHTDVSYLACVRLMVSAPEAFYPQFATHNAHTLAAAHVATGDGACEFQRLHGMGEGLYGAAMASERLGRPCRIYAPVGGHEDLLAYLVRRLLENGANTSFVNQLADDATPIAELVADPVIAAEAERSQGVVARQTAIPRPRSIYAPQRIASAGLALSEPDVREDLLARMRAALAEPFVSGPIVSGELRAGAEERGEERFCPHDVRALIGLHHVADETAVEEAITAASRASAAWEARPAEDRAQILERAADLLEADRARFMALIVREAGRTIQAAHDEVREAVDFLRYYAGEARRLFGAPVSLTGPTGETNTLTLRGRGPFAVICPWNFPLAILIGQTSAALAAGNPVLLKPAEQTPITARFAVELLHRAGVPGEVLHLLTGDGRIGGRLVRDRRVQGVAFTGSQETAWAIQADLAGRRSAIVPFIAETGGVNAMIADSSALPEQVVRDCVRSAFDSAGQRCSAARVLFVRAEIAARTIGMLAGAVEALDIGDPMAFSTDVGPVIDEAAQDALEAHKLFMKRQAREIIDPDIPLACRAGTYVTPAVYEIESLDLIERETFGPVLHVVRYGAGQLDSVIDRINAMGYGLTLGVHSRIEAVAARVAHRARVGNLYVNRDQIGAVVGVQPFGGEGLSGTGPKAGGPNYLARFATERVRTSDITATGGNAPLLRSIGQRVE